MLPKDSLTAGARPYASPLKSRSHITPIQATRHRTPLAKHSTQHHNPHTKKTPRIFPNNTDPFDSHTENTWRGQSTSIYGHFHTWMRICSKDVEPSSDGIPRGFDFGSTTKDKAIPGDARYQPTQQQGQEWEIVRHRKSTLIKCHYEEVTKEDANLARRQR